MDRTQSKTLAALWMAGWLSLMLIIAVAGRQAAREINVFQLSEMRSILGFLLLYPLIRAAGGFGAMKTKRHGACDAACRRYRGDPDGRPAGSPDRCRRLADLFGTAGSVHRASALR